MLPEIGASELMVIAAVALIVVGPKDLPILLRKIGQFVAKLRGLANDFRSSFDEMARQSELDELRREVAAMRAGQPPSVMTGLDDGHVSKTFEDIDASLNDRPLYDPAVTQDYVPPDTPAEDIPAEAVAPAPKRPRKPKAAPTTIEVLPEPAPKPARARAKAAATTAAKPAATKTKRAKA